ncbi:cornulin [Suncus etruscus]|uniref:cornulin n=1 Tax=Suncus etruscus TaxID=109475 RepID=UPI00210F81F1|nr:cornulin [Suncus etruscus]
MPQLLGNINGIIEAFGRYARTEDGCAVLTRGELKKLLEQEFADVIVKPHDPATVDEVLRLLDEDDTGTVDFKEYLVLVFKVAQACFKTLEESSGGACGSQPSGTHPPGTLQNKERQQSKSGGGGAIQGQQHEGSRHGQREKASKGQSTIETQSQDQGSSSPQDNANDRQFKAQNQPVGGDKSHKSKERQPQATEKDGAQQTDKSVTGYGTQVQADAAHNMQQGGDRLTGSTSTQSQQPSSGQNRVTERHSQGRSQTSQVVTGGQVQTQTGSHVQTQTQTLIQSSHHQTGSFQPQQSTCDQNRGTENHGPDASQPSQVTTGLQTGTQPHSHVQTTEQNRHHQTGSTGNLSQQSTHGHNHETHGQDRNQASQTVTRQVQTQTRSHTQTHTHTTQQKGHHQTKNTGNLSQKSTHGQSSGTGTYGQDRNQTSQVVTGGKVHTQTRPHTHTTEQDKNLTSGQERPREQGQTQKQSGSGQQWTEISNQEAGQRVQEGQPQTGTSSQEESSSTHLEHRETRGQGTNESTVVHREWVDDHTRETEQPTEGENESTVAHGEWVDENDSHTREMEMARQGENESTVTRGEWVDDNEDHTTEMEVPRQGGNEHTVDHGECTDVHRRETGVLNQGQGSLHTKVPSSVGQEASQQKVKGGISGLYSYFKSTKP